MTIQEYSDKVVNEFIENITDHIFIDIQNNEDKMREYMSNTNEHSLKAINIAIGKKIKAALNLKDKGIKNSPQSWLIKSFTKHSQ